METEARRGRSDAMETRAVGAHGGRRRSEGCDRGKDEGVRGWTDDG